MSRAAPLALLAVGAGCLPMLQDPAPGFFTSVADSRRAECERTTLEALRKAEPGRFEAARPRGDFADRGFVRCEAPPLQDARRPARDRAVLAGLAAEAAQLARRIAADAPADRTWLVEAHYPDAAVGAKLAFAAKAALHDEGLRVTDRAPVLAVGDVEVLARTPPRRAHALACRRYFAPGRLAAPDAVLALGVLDRRETILHAGTCVDGQWRWLQ